MPLPTDPAGEQHGGMPSTATAPTRSLAQAAASRVNGAKSNGPTSALGRATSCMNPVKHGMYAKTAVFSSDDQDAVRETIQDWMRRYGRGSRAAAELARHGAVSVVRLQRAERVRERLIEEKLAKAAEESPAARALAFAMEAKDVVAGLAGLAGGVESAIPQQHAAGLYAPVRRAVEAVMALNLPPTISYPFSLAAGALADDDRQADVGPDIFAALAKAAMDVVEAIDLRLPELARSVEVEQDRAAELLELEDDPQLRQVTRAKTRIFRELDSIIRSLAALRDLDAKVGDVDPDDEPVVVEFKVVGGPRMS